MKIVLSKNGEITIVVNVIGGSEETTITTIESENKANMLVIDAALRMLDYRKATQLSSGLARNAYKQISRVQALLPSSGN